MRTTGAAAWTAGTAGTNVSSTSRIVAPASSSENAISAGLQRMFTGVTTPPAHGTASRYS